MPKTKLYILAHDGTFEGDSGFHVYSDEAIPYVEGMTIEDLRKAFAEKQEAKYGEGWIDDDMISSVKGGWILTEAALKKLDKFQDKLHNAGNDSGDYAWNATCKVYVDEIATKHFGVKPE